MSLRTLQGEKFPSGDTGGVLLFSILGTTRSTLGTTPSTLVVVPKVLGAVPRTLKHPKSKDRGFRRQSSNCATEARRDVPALPAADRI